MSAPPPPPPTPQSTNTLQPTRLLILIMVAMGALTASADNAIRREESVSFKAEGHHSRHHYVEDKFIILLDDGTIILSFLG